MSDEYLNEQELADLLKVTRKTVQIWRQRGKGPPFVKLDRAVRYRRKDVDKFTAEHIQQSTHDNRQSTSEGDHGWTNYPTYLTYSWLAGDKQTHQQAIRWAQEGIEPLREGITTSAVRGIPVTGLGHSLIIHDLDTVNWIELQDALLD